LPANGQRDISHPEEAHMEDRNRDQAGERPVSNWAESEARDLADATRRRLDEAQRDVKGYANQAREYVQGAVDQTRDYADDAVRRARDKMTEYREGGLQRVRQDVTGYAREQPMTALLIAAGAGLVLGWLSAVGRR
jgi:ElaB/YqjD/DUF883 family membrane-anchored ribosome-binding protein